jgi:hypothetical protein
MTDSWRAAPPEERPPFQKKNEMIRFLPIQARRLLERKRFGRLYAERQIRRIVMKPP